MMGGKSFPAACARDGLGGHLTCTGGSGHWMAPAGEGRAGKCTHEPVLRGGAGAEPSGCCWAG